MHAAVSGAQAEVRSLLNSSVAASAVASRYLPLFGINVTNLRQVTINAANLTLPSQIYVNMTFALGFIPNFTLPTVTTTTTTGRRRTLLMTAATLALPSLDDDVLPSATSPSSLPALFDGSQLFNESDALAGGGAWGADGASSDPLSRLLRAAAGSLSSQWRQSRSSISALLQPWLASQAALLESTARLDAPAAAAAPAASTSIPALVWQQHREHELFKDGGDWEGAEAVPWVEIGLDALDQDLFPVNASLGFEATPAAATTPRPAQQQRDDVESGAAEQHAGTPLTTEERVQIARDWLARDVKPALQAVHDRFVDQLEEILADVEATTDSSDSLIGGFATSSGGRRLLQSGGGGCVTVNVSGLTMTAAAAAAGLGSLPVGATTACLAAVRSQLSRTPLALPASLASAAHDRHLSLCAAPPSRCAQTPTTDQALLSLISSALTDLDRLSTNISSNVRASNTSMYNLDLTFTAKDELYESYLNLFGSEVGASYNSMLQSAYTVYHVLVKKSRLEQAQQQALRAGLQLLTEAVIAANAAANQNAVQTVLVLQGLG